MTADQWIKGARAVIAGGGAMPPLAPLVRSLGIAGAVAGLQAEEKWDRWLRVELLPVGEECALSIQLWTGTEWRGVLERVQMPVWELMRKVSEVGG